MPTSADIDRFRKALPAQTDAIAQYVGMKSKGHRVIYGNFFPKDLLSEFTGWRTQPATVCDGGRGFFGAEFDVETGKVVHVAYNGFA